MPYSYYLTVTTLEINGKRSQNLEMFGSTMQK